MLKFFKKSKNMSTYLVYIFAFLVHRDNYKIIVYKIFDC